MLKLSLDALLTVDTIARRGSFAAAAKELFRVPSTISYTVAKLEEDLGVQLFERFGPRVTLTEAGEELLTEGRYLLKAAGDLERRVRRVASGWETEFTIAIDSMLDPGALMGDIQAFYEVADQTRLRLLKDALSGTWEALLDRRADLLVGAAGSGPSGGGYTSLPLATVSFVFVVAPGHPLAAIDRPLSKADLSAWRAVSVSDSARQLQARTVKREYFALVWGTPNLSGTIDAPMGRHPKDRVKMAVSTGMGAKPAITHYERVAEGMLDRRPVSLVRCSLETGRTHQIRVHMLSIGFGLVGDSVYGKTHLSPVFHRQALQARRLGLVHPATGEHCEWIVPLADDFAELIAKARIDEPEAA